MADLIKVTLPQMHVVIKATRVVAPVTAVQAPANASDQSGLMPEQLMQFNEWIKANPQVNTMIRLPDTASAETDDSLRFRFLSPCGSCNTSCIRRSCCGAQPVSSGYGSADTDWWIHLARAIAVSMSLAAPVRVANSGVMTRPMT